MNRDALVIHQPETNRCSVHFFQGDRSFYIVEEVGDADYPARHSSSQLLKRMRKPSWTR